MLKAAHQRDLLEDRHMKNPANPFGITRGSSVMFFDAHPGSLVRTCAGALLRSGAVGARVTVIDACDGAAMVERESDGPAMAARRHREALAALKILGVPREDYFALGFPDGGLEAMRGDYWHRTGLPYFCPWLRADRVATRHAWRRGAPFFGESFFAALKSLLAARRPTHVFTHHFRDTHMDHRALTWFIRKALAELVAEGRLKRTPTVFEWITYYSRAPWPPKGKSIPVNAARKLRFPGRVVEFVPSPAEQRVKTAAWRANLPSHGAAYVKRWTKTNEIFWRTD
jgi:LmbE family N-acetylglucosaminyl deacetylase